MNEKNTSQLKDYILIIMGLVISLAGIIYIVIQYSKLISEPAVDEANDQEDSFSTKLRSRFKQIQQDEGTSPDVIDEGDLSIDIE